MNAEKKVKMKKTLGRLSIFKEADKYSIAIDGEELGFMIQALELRLTHDSCQVAFEVPLESVEVDIDQSEFMLKVRDPEEES